MADERAFGIRQLRADDDLTSIKVSDDDSQILKTFLTSSARPYAAARLARTYGLFETREPTERLVGYMTLVSASVDTGYKVTLLDDVPPEPDGYDAAHEPVYPYTVYPALKIARLLIDEDYRGNDLGTDFLSHAARVATARICPWIGCRFLVVDSKQSAIEFYKKRGFALLNTKNNLKRRSPMMFNDLIHNDVAEEPPAAPQAPPSQGGYIPKAHR